MKSCEPFGEQRASRLSELDAVLGCIFDSRNKGIYLILRMLMILLLNNHRGRGRER